MVKVIVVIKLRRGGLPIKRILLLTLLILPGSVLQAQVYKCTGPDGTVAFSDKACGEHAELVKDLDSGSSGVGSNISGPPSSLTFGDGSILPYKNPEDLERIASGLRNAGIDA